MTTDQATADAAALAASLQRYTSHTAPALNIDDYAAQIYHANRSAGL